MDKLLIITISLLILTLTVNCQHIDFSEAPKLPDINQTIYDIINKIPDPLVVQNQSITIPDGSFAGDASIGNFKITGIHSLKVPVLKLSLGFLKFKLDMQLVLESFVLSTNYKAGLKILYGDGDLTVDLSNLSVNITSDITLALKTKNLQIKINLGGVAVKLNGYYYDDKLSQLISKGLTRDAAKYINDNQEIITNLLSPILQDVINEVLSGNKKNKEMFETLITQLAQQDEFVDDGL